MRRDLQNPTASPWVWPHPDGIPGPTATKFRPDHMPGAGSRLVGDSQDGGLPGSGPRRSGEGIAAGRYLLLGVSLVVSALIGGARVDTLAQPPHGAPVVRLAELQIDPARLDQYKAALRDEIETSIRLEPGVLTLYAVSVKGHPAQIRLFEMYADQAAYEAHLNTPHFLKYKTGTQHMVKSLVLIETDPILLGAKRR